jgi:predicted HTH domain antitoxin
MPDRYLPVSDVPGLGITLSCAWCAEGDDSPPGGPWRPAQLAHLYLCDGLSTYRIAELTGIDRQRVTRQLRRAGVALRPRGAGRLRPLRRRDPPGLAELIIDLYREGRVSSRQIAAVTGLPERTVRDRLRRYGVPARTRGRWNREDRRAIPAATLRSLYEQLGLTAAEVGATVGACSNIVLRSAHDLGMPVRIGGSVQSPGPDEIELIDALYQDGLVTSVLAVHQIQRVPPGAPIWRRFPVPVPLSAPLVKDLYWSCGLGLNHIELLTGQPAGTVRGFMRREGIPLRHPGGRTPFRRRWRTSEQAAATAQGGEAP